MSVFDLKGAVRRAEARLSGGRVRARRSDVGRSRFDARVAARLTELLAGYRKPPVPALLAELQRFCREHGVRCPSRAAVYAFMARAPCPIYSARELPPNAREVLYNLGADAAVPGHQLAFYCFNYGGVEAMSFAAGLPWLCLYQAGRMRGWRSRSRGLLEAARRARRA